MKPFFAFAAVALTFCAPISRVAASQKPVSSTRSAPKKSVLKVTEKNFVSLKWQRSGGRGRIQTQVLIHPTAIQLHRGAPDNESPSQNQALGKAEFQAILKAVNDAHFTKIVGKYNEPRMADGFRDVVTLVLRTPGKNPQSFVVDSYGGAAPKAFRDVTESLRVLQNQKFADQQN